MTKRLIAVLVALGLALAANVAVPLAAASAASSGHTRVVIVQPTDAYGFLKSGYRVLHTLYGGDCRNESEVVAGTDRCFAGSRIFDPCWATINSHARYNGSFCPDAPWRKPGILIRGRHTAKYDTSRHLWAVQLRDGRRCEFAQGATAVFHGQRLNFYCSGPGHKWLVGVPYTQRPFWRITEVTWAAGQPRSPVRVAIGTAWFGREPA